MARRKKIKVEKSKDPEVGDMSVDVLGPDGEVEDTKFFPGGVGLSDFTSSVKKKCRVFKYVGWEFEGETNGK